MGSGSEGYVKNLPETRDEDLTIIVDYYLNITIIWILLAVTILKTHIKER